MSTHVSTPRKRLSAKTATIIAMESILARLEIAPYRRQFSIGGPSRGWFISQLWRRSELRSKAKAAKIRNGTVGSTGTKLPMTPSAKATIPNARHAFRETAPLS